MRSWGEGWSGHHGLTKAAGRDCEEAAVVEVTIHAVVTALPASASLSARLSSTGHLGMA